MTESERAAAVERAKARQDEIERARALFEALPARRRTVLRASYERAEDDAAAVVHAGRRFADAD